MPQTAGNTPTPGTPFTARRLLIMLTIIAVGLGLRLFDLEADAPAFFADGSQDFTTDGAYLTLFARNQVQFGEWSPFGYEHWQTFKTSLITGVSYLFYVVFGVTVATGALVGLALNCLGLVLFLWLFSRRFSFQATLIALIVVACDFVLIQYGRFPFSENALLLGAALVFLSYLESTASLLWSIGSGLLIAVIAFFCKAFGLLLAVPFVLWWLAADTERRWILISGHLVSIGVGVVVLSFALHGTFELGSFLWMHGTAGHGFPHGLQLPFGPFENFFSFGRTGLHEYTPLLSAGVFVALLWLTFFKETELQLRKPLVFMVGWIVGWVVVLSVFNYRPLRYQYLLIVPMTLIVAHFLTRSHQMVRRYAKVRWWQVALVLVVCWYFVYHAVTPFAIESLSLRMYQLWVWYLLPVAALLTGFIIYVLSSRQIRVSATIARTVTIVIVAGSLATGSWLYTHWYTKRTYGVRDANRDMQNLLGPNAVVSGQIGPALTCATSVRSFPLFVKYPLSANDSILSKYPITHLALPISLWEALRKNNPEFAASPVVARFWIRDNVNYVVPVYDLFGNAEAARYLPTPFEQGARLMKTGGRIPPDSLIRETLKAAPANRTALVYLYHWLAHTDRLDQCGPIVDTLVANYPTDFSVNLLAAVFLRIQSERLDDQSLMIKARAFLDQAIKYNPRNEEVLRRTFVQITPDKFEM